MSSLFIPELVTGIPLFVPSDKNFFSIEADSLPNGDPALVVHGDVGRSYRAYQAAQTLSPDVFLARRSTFSLSFWIKSTGFATSPALSSPGIAHMDYIMGAMTTSFDPSVNSYPLSSINGTLADRHQQSVWGICADLPSNGPVHNRIGFWRAATGGVASTARTQYVTAPLNNDGWSFVVISASESDGSSALNAMGPITSFVNLVEYPGTAVSAGVGGNVIPVASGQHFSLGAYSDAASVSGRRGEYRIAKICFHDHILNQTEREQLYYAMTDS